MREWQNRPLERVYAAIFLDAVRCKVRHEGRVVNKAAYLAVGMDSNGAKDVTGHLDRFDRGREVLAGDLQ